MRYRKFLIILTLCFTCYFTGCSNNSKQESNNVKFAEVDKVSFLSFTNEYLSYSMSTHHFKNNLNDWFRHQDMYETTTRIFDEISSQETDYSFSNVDTSVDNFIENGEGHFVVVDMLDEGQLPIENKEYKTLVFNAENGDIWLGVDRDHLTLSSKNFNSDYMPDKQLCEYIEGHWEVPEYDNFYEYLNSCDWMSEE